MAEGKQTGEIDIDTTPRADEELVEAQGDIRVSKLKAGGRRLVHPSGAEVVETVSDLTEWRAELVTEIADRQKLLVAFDADRTIVLA